MGIAGIDSSQVAFVGPYYADKAAALAAVGLSE
jgi:hypothetical protein